MGMCFDFGILVYLFHVQPSSNTVLPSTEGNASLLKPIRGVWGLLSLCLKHMYEAINNWGMGSIKIGSPPLAIITVFVA